MKLQNNFTTPEQSKRLLKLGVPADSADCFYHSERYWISILQMEDVVSDFKDRFNRFPCWSVGRLIEIYAIAMDSDVIDFDTYANSHCVLKELLEKYERNRDLLDFSKLEE